MRHWILVVEDDVAFANALGDLLLRIGHEPILVHSLADAHDLLGTIRTDVALVDYHLADGVGTTLADALKAWDPTLFVACITADAERARKDDSFDAVIEKPIDEELLRRLLQRAIAWRTTYGNCVGRRAG